MPWGELIEAGVKAFGPKLAEQGAERLATRQFAKSVGSRVAESAASAPVERVQPSAPAKLQRQHPHLGRPRARLWTPQPKRPVVVSHRCTNATRCTTSVKPRRPPCRAL